MGCNSESLSFPDVLCLFHPVVLQFSQSKVLEALTISELTTSLPCGMSRRDGLHDGKSKLVFLCVLLLVHKKGKFQA